MSQASWFINNVGVNGDILIGPDGTAELHSSLANPLTSSGLHCRAFQVSTIATSSFGIASLVPIGSQFTNSLGYSYGKAYSLRTWVRNTVSTPARNSISLIFKGDNNTSIGGNSGNIINYASSAPSGYRLFLNGQTLQLTCASVSSSLSSGSGPTDYYGHTIFNNTLTANTWHRLRLDVIPMSTSIDTVTVYTGSMSDDSLWSQVHTVNITSSQIGAYIPWSTTPYGYLGFATFSLFTGNFPYVDKFEIYRKDAGL